MKWLLFAFTAFTLLVSSTFAQQEWVDTVLGSVTDTVTLDLDTFLMGDFVGIFASVLTMGFVIVVTLWAYRKIKRGFNKAG